jgi:hypothetical protein
MKKIFITIEFFFSFFILGCVPALFFDIKNSTGEIIEIDYDICDDLLIHYINPIKNVQVKLENEDISTVKFATTDLFNRGVSAADLFYTETFLSFFENITIKFQSSGIILKKDDLNQCKIEYVKYLGGSKFILVIEEITKNEVL